MNFGDLKEKSNKPPILVSCFLNWHCEKDKILKGHMGIFNWKESERLYCAYEYI